MRKASLLALALVWACHGSRQPGVVPLDGSFAFDTASSAEEFQAQSDLIGHDETPPREFADTKEDVRGGDEGQIDTDRQEKFDLEEVIPTVCPEGSYCPCRDASECESGVCVETENGGVCSHGCDEDGDCGEGLKCVETDTHGKVCADLFSRLCMPCMAKKDCVLPSVSQDYFECVPYGKNGSFCGVSCNENSDCPGDYLCLAISGAPRIVKMCVRMPGEDCACPDRFKGFETLCYETNPFGTCYAKRTCDVACNAPTPAKEECNGKDDDCDGLTDEDVVYDKPGTFCPTTGVCSAGVPIKCINGKWECDFASVPGYSSQDCYCGDCEDNDCDGQTDEDICCQGDNCCPQGDPCDTDWDNDGVPNRSDNCPHIFNPSQNDLDGDGVGDDCDNDIDGDGVTNDLDCDPRNNNVYPGATETCNLIDDDCDGQTDEEGSAGCKYYYQDSDGDGFGAPTTSKCLCAPVPPFTAPNGVDCDDRNSQVNPSAPEVCNGVDDNCNGSTDEDNAGGCTTYFRDNDNDGFGVAGDARCLCAPRSPFSATKIGDCNDANPNIYPGAVESCNGVDDDCDGVTDQEGSQGCRQYYLDADGDNFGTGTPRCLCRADGLFRATVSGDCNDSDPSINPEAVEMCDGRDNDCDGTIDEEGAQGCIFYYKDVDGDTFGTSDRKCLCLPSGSYRASRVGDCDDTDPNVFPGAPEVCNGKDDNCDGITDPESSVGCKTYYIDWDNDGFGPAPVFRCLCAPTAPWTATTLGDCDDRDPAVYPGAPAVCGKDGDCDGNIVDPGEECDDGNSTDWDGCTSCKRSETLVNQVTQGEQSRPSVAGLSGGGFVVVWHAKSDIQDGSGYGIYARVFDSAGRPSGVEYQVNEYTTGDQRMPHVAALQNNRYMVVWHTQYLDGSGYGIAARLSDSNETIPVNQYTAGNQLNPKVANVINRGERPAVVYQSFGFDGDDYGIASIVFPFGSSEQVVNVYTTSTQETPVIAKTAGASDADPAFYVVWRSVGQDGSQGGIYGRRFRNFQFGPEFRINSYTTGDQASPAIASFADGSFVVVWSSYNQDRSNYGIFGAIFDKDGNKIVDDFRCNTFTTDSQTSPSVATVASGRFVVVWQSNLQDGDKWGIYGQIFMRDGTQFGQEFRVNTYTTGSQTLPAVSALRNGGFVVVWQSSGQIDDQGDVFFQLFDDSGNKVY